MTRLLLESLAVRVFLGTLPLLGALLWGFPRNKRRLRRIEAKVDSMDAKRSAVA